MNLYLVVSEPIYDVVYEDWSVGAGHREDYCIVELVVARNYSQARYLAWKSDSRDTSWPTIEDMPKFTVRIKAHNVEGPARVVSEEYILDHNRTYDEEYTETYTKLWTIGGSV